MMQIVQNKNIFLKFIHKIEGLKAYKMLFYYRKEEINLDFQKII